MFNLKKDSGFSQFEGNIFFLEYQTSVCNHKKENVKSEIFRIL